MRLKKGLIKIRGDLAKKKKTKQSIKQAQKKNQTVYVHEGS